MCAGPVQPTGAMTRSGPRRREFALAPWQRRQVKGCNGMSARWSRVRAPFNPGHMSNDGAEPSGAHLDGASLRVAYRVSLAASVSDRPTARNGTTALITKSVRPTLGQPRRAGSGRAAATGQQPVDLGPLLLGVLAVRSIDLPAGRRNGQGVLRGTSAAPRRAPGRYQRTAPVGRRRGTPGRHGGGHDSAGERPDRRSSTPTSTRGVSSR